MAASVTTNVDYVLPTGTNSIRLTQVRNMFGLHQTETPRLSHYIKDGSLVNNTTYNTAYNPYNNTLADPNNPNPVSTSTNGLRLSQFRGAFKEYRISTPKAQAPYTVSHSTSANITVPTTGYKTYRIYVNDRIYSTSNNYDNTGIGKPGLSISLAGNSRTRIIVHVTSNGQIGGGPGAGGSGGSGGAGGVGGNPGGGATTPGTRGGDANSTNASNGGTAPNDNSSGKRGGHAIDVSGYNTNNEILHIGYHTNGNTTTLFPGGGGGGGTGGGGGGGAGESGGGGGHGARGFNRYTSTEYDTSGSNRTYVEIYYDEFTFYDDGCRDGYTRVYWRGSLVYYDSNGCYGNANGAFGSGSTVTQNRNSVHGFNATLTKGNRRSYETDNTEVTKRYEVQSNDARTYYEGGDGGSGARGHTGQTGYNGPAGKHGAYLDSNGNKQWPAQNGAQSDKSDGTVENAPVGGSNPPTTNITIRGGDGGRGGYGGASGGGGGYAAGGRGGDYGQQGASGGDGNSGRAGVTTGNDAAGGAYNARGEGDGRSDGGSSYGRTSGGAGRAGKSGGDGGQLITTNSRVTVTSGSSI